MAPMSCGTCCCGTSSVAASREGYPAAWSNRHERRTEYNIDRPVVQNCSSCMTLNNTPWVITIKTALKIFDELQVDTEPHLSHQQPQLVSQAPHWLSPTCFLSCRTPEPLEHHITRQGAARTCLPSGNSIARAWPEAQVALTLAVSSTLKCRVCHL